MRYKEIYNRNFANDIKNEFRWDPKNNENLVRELNDIMMPLGYKLEPISKDLGRQMTYRWIIWGAKEKNCVKLERVLRLCPSEG